MTEPSVEAPTSQRPTVFGVHFRSGDVTDATPDEIRAFTVIATIVGGNVAFCSDEEICGSD